MGARYLRLSYVLSPDTPVYRDNPRVKLTRLRDIQRGDAANTYYVETHNHNGTHVDVPYHFDARGRTLDQYQIGEFVFEHPLVLDVPKRDGELLQPADFAPHRAALAACDLLLIRTGFGQYRSTDPARYQQQNPGCSAAAAEYLLRHAALLRAVGFDIISTSSGLHRDEGRAAHRVFLAQAVLPRTVLLIEDMFVPADLPPLRRVFVAPLLVRGLDGAPCTVIGELA